MGSVALVQLGTVRFEHGLLQGVARSAAPRPSHYWCLDDTGANLTKGLLTCSEAIIEGILDTC